MKKGDFLFVYGTLRRGERADLQKQSHHFGVSFCGEDDINGKLYHIGAFPGLKPCASPSVFDENLPTVHGEVFLIRESAMTAIMDAYEGYNAAEPEHGLYNRCQFETATGKQAWAYVYNGMIIPDQQIDCGDWCKAQGLLIRERQLRA